MLSSDTVEQGIKDVGQLAILVFNGLIIRGIRHMKLKRYFGEKLFCVIPSNFDHEIVLFDTKYPNSSYVQQIYQVDRVSDLILSQMKYIPDIVKNTKGINRL